MKVQKHCELLLTWYENSQDINCKLVENDVSNDSNHECRHFFDIKHYQIASLKVNAHVFGNAIQ